MGHLTRLNGPFGKTEHSTRLSVPRLGGTFDRVVRLARVPPMYIERTFKVLTVPYDMIPRIEPKPTKEQSLQTITRFTFTLLIAIITSLGAFALVGCTDDSQQQSESAATQTTESSTESTDASSDDDQENCYGNDLPAVKK